MSYDKTCYMHLKVGVEQGCPKYGPQAKCSLWSNFIRSTASVMEYISKKIEIKKQMAC